MKFRDLFALFLAVAILLPACTSIPVEQRPDKRAELSRIGEEIVARAVEEEPGLQQALDLSASYFAAEISAANVAVLGGGQGYRGSGGPAER